MLQFLSEQKDR